MRGEASSIQRSYHMRISGAQSGQPTTTRYWTLVNTKLNFLMVMLNLCLPIRLLNICSHRLMKKDTGMFFWTTLLTFGKIRRQLTKQMHLLL